METTLKSHPLGKPGLISELRAFHAIVIPISLMLPLTYGLDAVRGWLLQTDTLLPLNMEILLLIVSMFLMLWFGAWVFNRIERRVRILGTLGQH